MQKDATYKEKFELLAPWIPSLILTVKKDLKNDHIKRDAPFCKRFLQGKNINKLTDSDLVEAYSKAVKESEDGEALAEFISNRWLLKNGEIYHFYEQHLSAIDPNFSDLQQLSDDAAKKLSAASVKEFGPLQSYLFAVINSVVFPDSVFKDLAMQAKETKLEQDKQEEERQKTASVEDLKRSYEQQIARLTDKYEKKLSGLQKKYVQDMEAFKKQLAQLQRKLT